MGKLMLNGRSYTGGWYNVPVIYNEDEREIGVWADSKPLYQKTITLTPTSSIVAIQHDIANVDLIVDIKGVGVRSDYGVVPANCARSSNLVGVWADRTSVGFSISNADYVNAPFILTLQYTKTTDSPGSGTWTPNGELSHHYSTDEQVVGTWIDGSTVYERTFTLSERIQIHNNYSNILIEDLSDYGIYNLIDCFSYDSNGGSDLTRIRLITKKIDFLISSNNELIANASNNNEYAMTAFTIRYTKTTVN